MYMYIPNLIKLVYTQFATQEIVCNFSQLLAHRTSDCNGIQIILMSEDILNKMPLGLTAPLSNNTRSMIYSPMNTK